MIDLPLRQLGRSGGEVVGAVGDTAGYLASVAGACTTGEVIRVDGGFHVLGMPQQENL